MIWVDPSDPLVYSTVTTGCPDPAFVVPSPPDETVEQALEEAGDLLTRLTGYLVHPAGEATEDFRATPRTHRLSPNYLPLRDVITVQRLDPECVATDVTNSGWCVIGHSIYFSPSQCTLAYWYRDVCGCQPISGEVLRLTYSFGSTVTAAAKRALLTLARQFWLVCNPDAGVCELPERTTSVNREGLSYTILDPQEFLTLGRTGLPRVDLWLAAVNPSRALRPSGVWTPDSPPPVNRFYQVSV